MTSEHAEPPSVPCARRHVRAAILNRTRQILRDATRPALLSRSIACCTCFICCFAATASGQKSAPSTRPATEPARSSLIPSTEPAVLPGMSLDELLNTEVTLVSRRPERVAESPSSIQIITGEEIRRSGALSLPEALRLAPNLQVAQLNAHDWAITSRGFNAAPAANNSFADKLLVMIDGRSVYTPLFGGVFWDVQNVLLEDIDRIEIVSGPGGTLWGANAVNGVINIVTKSARDTQGLYLTGAVGSFWQDYGAMRYGGRIGQDLYYRIYAQGFKHDNTELGNGKSVNDEWDMTHGGVRMDYTPSAEDNLTFEGDGYNGTEGDPTVSSVSGGNFLARWNHVISDKSDFRLQTYFDNTGRDLPISDISDQMRTYDFDFQHRFPLGDRQSVTWGMGYRITWDNIHSSPALSFIPADRTLQLFSAFVQDELQIIPDRLKLTLGSKFEHNDYSGFEIQPSARIAWFPAQRQTVWAAVSRAVRSPSRFDQDESAATFSTPGNFKSEKLTAYELGYRIRPIDWLSLSVATFYNNYDDLRSIEVNAAPPPTLVFANNQRADTWGLELSADLQVAEWWRLRGGYTYLDENIWATNAAVIPGDDAIEANDPYNQIVLQSMMDLPGHFQFDLTGRYVGDLGTANIPGYVAVDARLAWHYRNVELSVVGQNLLDGQHPEFGPQEIPRSVYGQMTLRW